MKKFHKALKKFVKELFKKHPNVQKHEFNVKSVSVEDYLNQCNLDFDNFENKSVSFENDVFSGKLSTPAELLKDVSEEVQAMVWKYLHSMYIYAFYDTNTKHEVETFLQKYGRADVPSYVGEDWQRIGRIYKIVYGSSESRNTELSSSPASGGNVIHNLASEIAGDLQNDENFASLLQSGGANGASPQNLMQNLLSGSNPELLQKMFSTVSTKLNDKISSSELNEEDIVSQAQSMLGNMQNNPMMSAMMESMMASGLQPPEK